MKIPSPVYRRLGDYSFDPSLFVQLDAALVNKAVFKINLEVALQVGHISEYVEVIDFDQASNSFYSTVDLNGPAIPAKDEFTASESNPQFYKQGGFRREAL